MRHILKGIFFFLIFICSTVYAASEINNSPIGFWKTIDDTTGKPKAIVQLWETPEQTLYGKVIKVFPDRTQEQKEFCTACAGEKKNKRIIGLVIIENLKQSKDDTLSWSGGTILDPKSGKVYRSNLYVIDNGRKLNVKGYIGAPLFGRTQTWIRVADPTEV